MSGGHEDPVVLDDESCESTNMTDTHDDQQNKPKPSGSLKQQQTSIANGDSGGEEDDNPTMQETDDEDAESNEYHVEAIRGRRKNAETGEDEYLIKWKGYEEKDNTWEPLGNLKCPHLMREFEEKEANKRRRKRAKQNELTPQPSKRLRRGTSVNGSEATQQDDEDKQRLLLEDDDDENLDDDLEIASASRNKGKHRNNHHQKEKENKDNTVSLKGFERGLPLERILNASVGDNDKLYWFVKFEGRNEVEMVDGDELEQKASYELCRWYRNRLYWKGNDNNNDN